MGIFTKDIKSMNDLFVHTLKDIYYAENQIVKSLPDMIEKASDARLKQGLQAHLGETKGHVQRLEQAFQMLDKKPKNKSCAAMKGLITEAQERIQANDEGALADSAMICAAQKV